jgi:hypothetical protein
MFELWDPEYRKLFEKAYIPPVNSSSAITTQDIFKNCSQNHPKDRIIVHLVKLRQGYESICL